MRFLPPAVVLLALSTAHAEDAPGVKVSKADELFKKRQYGPALKLLNEAIKDDADLALAYQLRGCTRYMMGDFKDAVADFDKNIALEPKAFHGNWQRGIALYYVGRYEDGAKQFKGYEKVTKSDVENTFWHWMCTYRKDGAKKARESLLATGKDGRAPMNEVLQLIQGKLKPEDVLKAAEDEPKARRAGALFYGHLYLGLYHDITGDRKKAVEHLDKAAKGTHPSGYMGEVARVHRDWLKGMK
jgi:lipoprotein NlpI